MLSHGNGHLLNGTSPLMTSSSKPVVYKLGIYGWRKRCLFFLIFLIALVSIINLALIVWIMRVQHFGLVSPCLFLVSNLFTFMILQLIRSLILDTKFNLCIINRKAGKISTEFATNAAQRGLIQANKVDIFQERSR